MNFDLMNLCDNKNLQVLDKLIVVYLTVSSQLIKNATEPITTIATKTTNNICFKSTNRPPKPNT